VSNFPPYFANKDSVVIFIRKFTRLSQPEQAMLDFERIPQTLALLQTKPLYEFLNVGSV
jgi:hypothetical protein